MSENATVNFGMVGLGKMGANIVRRLQRHGISTVVYDISPDAVAELAGEGATASVDYADFASKLAAPRVVWVGLPEPLAGGRWHIQRLRHPSGS